MRGRSRHRSSSGRFGPSAGLRRRTPGHAHELEYVDYYLDDDGTLFLRARLAAEDGTLLIKALEAARERVLERRREERAAAANDPQARGAERGG